MVHWADKYVGTPFKAYGRSMHACDCWGLIRLVLFNEAHITVPSFTDVDFANNALVEEVICQSSDKPEWLDVLRGQEIELDVVMMKSPVYVGGFLRNAVVHVGIFIEHGRILHTEEKMGAIIQSATDLEFRIHRVKRHRLRYITQALPQKTEKAA